MAGGGGVGLLLSEGRSFFSGGGRYFRRVVPFLVGGLLLSEGRSFFSGGGCYFRRVVPFFSGGGGSLLSDFF